MAAFLTDLRDEVYTRLLVKRTVEGFPFNNFTVKKTSYPQADLESFIADYPNGLVYVVAGVPGDIRSESRTNIAKAEYSVKIGFQKGDIDATDNEVVDPLYEFVEALARLCRKEVDPTSDYSFTALEWQKDANEVPLSFLGLRHGFFEAYFTAFYTIAHE